MHCLEVIVARNERAAARAEGHASNDGNWQRAFDIARATPMSALTPNYVDAYSKAREEEK